MTVLLLLQKEKKLVPLDSYMTDSCCVMHNQKWVIPVAEGRLDRNLGWGQRPKKVVFVVAGWIVGIHDKEIAFDFVAFAADVIVGIVSRNRKGTMGFFDHCLLLRWTGLGTVPICLQKERV